MIYFIFLVQTWGGLTMHLGTIYLIVNDFQKSIEYYEKLLQMSVT